MYCLVINHKKILIDYNEIIILRFISSCNKVEILIIWKQESNVNLII